MTLVVTHTTQTGAAADPSALVDGPAWDASHLLGGVVDISQGGTGQSTATTAFDALAPTTTRGDLIRRSASQNSRLAIGTSGYALISDGTDPAWAGYVPAGTGAVTRTWQSKTSDVVSILDFIPVNLHAGIRDGSGSTDLQTYLAAARTYAGTLSQPCEIVFPSGKYTTSVSPNWALNNLSLRTEGDVYWNYTGTGNCFIVDGGASPATGVLNMNIGRFRIIGTSSSLHGAYFRSILHSTIEGPTVHGCGTTSDGIRTEFCVLSLWNRPTVSNNEGSFGSAAPAVGLRVTQRSASSQTAYCTFVNPIMEGLAVGARFDDSIGNTVLGGAFEGCSSQGLLLGTTAVYNKFFGVAHESNTQDIYCAGDHNSFIDCDTHTAIILDSSTNGNIVKGGVHKAITIQASGVNNCVEFARYNWDNSGATITDGGTNSRLFSNLDIGNNAWNSGSVSFGGLVTASNGLTTSGAVSFSGASPGMLLAKVTGVNFNSANTDNAITISLPSGFTRWRMSSMVISNVSAVPLTTATFGVFTSTGGGGVTIVTGGTATNVTSIAANTAGNGQSLPVVVLGGSTWMNVSTIYFRVQTAQGSAATGDVTIAYIPVP